MTVPSDPISKKQSLTIQEKKVDQPKPKVNGFEIAENGNASRSVRLESGREVIITVSFPGGITEGDKNKRLNQFTEDALKVLGQKAYDLGLGRVSKKDNFGKISSITFNQDGEGHWGATKIYNSGKIKNLDTAHYEKKISDEKDSKKIKKSWTDKKNSFAEIKELWTKLEKGESKKTDKKEDDKKTKKNSKKDPNEIDTHLDFDKKKAEDLKNQLSDLEKGKEKKK